MHCYFFIHVSLTEKTNKTLQTKQEASASCRMGFGERAREWRPRSTDDCVLVVQSLCPEGGGESKDRIRPGHREGRRERDTNKRRGGEFRERMDEWRKTRSSIKYSSTEGLCFEKCTLITTTTTECTIER